MGLGLFARRDFLIFTAARVAGIGIRPLILLVTALYGFPDFADAFALFATAIAGSFVVFSNEAHIRLYRQRFNDSRDILGLYLATRFFVVNVVSHIVWFALIGALLLYMWTGNPAMAVSGLLVLFAEKIYDEYQRYYTFKHAYIAWTIGFLFRYGVPGLTVLIPTLLGGKPSLAVYITAYVVACIVYVALFERRSMALFKRVYARAWRGGRSLIAYVGTYFRELYANQAWSFLAANFYLLDRIMISQSPVGLGAYVFFCSLFNITFFAHNTLYFVHRRASIIRNEAKLRHEVFRPANTLPPLLYVAGVIVIALGFMNFNPVYREFDLVLLVGLAIYYYGQSISQVALDFTFWRIARQKLVPVDAGLCLLGLALFFGTNLPYQWVPMLMAGLIATRILIYALIWRASGGRDAFKMPTR